MKCISPPPPGSPSGIHGNSGRPSRAILSFPDEPLILKFLTLSTNSPGKELSSVIFKNVLLTSKLDTIFFA